jgi:CelD/BcsL family acetyltransferase involved in cellulose biosynthesis
MTDAMFDASLQLVSAPRGPIATDVRQHFELSIHDDMSAVEHIWRRFEQFADCTVFQTFDWLSAWQRHIGSRHGVRPAIVLGQLLNGDILFLLPLAVEKNALISRLTWLGHDLSD